MRAGRNSTQLLVAICRPARASGWQGSVSEGLDLRGERALNCHRPDGRSFAALAKRSSWTVRKVGVVACDVVARADEVTR
jgi:hypothetical protein